jgi:hypothetical protein
MRDNTEEEEIEYVRLAERITREIAEVSRRAYFASRRGADTWEENDLRRAQSDLELSLIYAFQTLRSR